MYVSFIRHGYDDIGLVGLLGSLNPSTLPLHKLGVVCWRDETVQTVQRFVRKWKLRRIRVGVYDVSVISDEDLIDMWKTIIGCKHIQEVELYDDDKDVVRQCKLLKELLRGLPQSQRDALDWRRVGRFNHYDRTDITNIDVFNNLVPSLNMTV